MSSSTDQHDVRLDLTSLLSVRERQVVTLISRGLSNREIADTLFLSINSVKTYVRTAYRRLEVTNRSHAVIWGIRNEQRLVELEEQDATGKRALRMVRPDGA